MKKLYEQTNILVTELQMIADAISEYNPGLRKDKTPLSVIQHDLACFGREITGLYAEIGKKVREGE